MAHVALDAAAYRLHALAEAALRTPTDSQIVNGAVVFTFEPALSPAEQTVYDRLRRIAYSNVPTITPAEWQAVEPDIDGLRNYHALASPTAAQTAQATKALIRIVRGLVVDLRDS